jgi:holo-[acyl-carrier protein] synthase
MGILGIGVDLVEKRRIEEALNRWGRHFSDRILTEREALLCDAKGDRVGSIAARFAAKEAVLKALGTGWNHEIGWKDIEILSEESGLPRVILSRGAGRRVGTGRVWLSLSHSREQAAAFVVIETPEEISA